MSRFRLAFAVLGGILLSFTAGGPVAVLGGGHSPRAAAAQLDGPTVAQLAACDSGNLLANGDAEAGPVNTTHGGTDPPSGWVTTGSLRILAYGTSTFPAATDPGPPDRGGALFVGGPSSKTSTITQTFSLAAQAQAIDDGRLDYALCGWLGGFGGQDDAATLSVTFQNGAGVAVGFGSIGPALDAERGGVTALVEKSTSGAVPAGTRTAIVVLTAERVAGNSNDGYADNLVFTVAEGEVPPPDDEPPPDEGPPPTLPDAGFPLIVQTLQPGWHLVGWSGATTGRNAFDFITGRFDAGFTFNPNTKQFRQFRPTAPDFLNNLDQVAFGDGVWIFIEEESTWLQPAPWWARDVELVSGFNLVLWTGPNDTPVEDAYRDLGSALISAFTWKAGSQEFLGYGPNRPAFLNTASVLNYGDGVWIDVDRNVTWRQPAIQRVGAQSILFFHNIARVDDGEDVDVTDAVLAAVSRDLGPPVPLQFGLVFQESRSLGAVVRAENGVRIPNVRMRFGVVSRNLTAAQSGDVTVVEGAADFFLGQRFAVPALISTPHLEEALYNIDINDLISIDLTDVSGIEVGDELALTYIFAQTLERRPPLSEGGLSDAEIFARRWNAGDLAILAAEDDRGGTSVVLNRTQAVVGSGAGLAAAQFEEMALAMIEFEGQEALWTTVHFVPGIRFLLEEGAAAADREDARELADRQLESAQGMLDLARPRPAPPSGSTALDGTLLEINPTSVPRSAITDAEIPPFPSDVPAATCVAGAGADAVRVVCTPFALPGESPADTLDTGNLIINGDAESGTLRTARRRLPRHANGG